MADLGHLASELEVHKQWVSSLEEVRLHSTLSDSRSELGVSSFFTVPCRRSVHQELFRQGDWEKRFGLAVSPLMDRTKPGVTKSQCSFFSIVALPLFKVTSRDNQISLVVTHSQEQPNPPLLADIHGGLPQGFRGSDQSGREFQRVERAGGRWRTALLN